MTVKKLVEELCKYDGNMEVFVSERKTEFAYGLVSSVTSKEIGMKDDPDSDVILAKVKVVILDEE